MRHALFVTSIGLGTLSLIACGLGIEGTMVTAVDAGSGGPDASLPPPGEPFDGSTADAEPGDAVADAASDAPLADAADAGPCSDPSLVLCLRFENNLTDEAHGAAATTSGVLTYAGGKAGNAVVVSSTTSIHFDNSAPWTSTALSAEAWVRPDAIPTGTARAGILDKDGSFGMFLYANGLVSCLSGSAVASSNGAQQGQWIHVACVNDGVTLKLFLDGVEKASAGSAAVANLVTVAAVGGNSPSGDPLTGALDTFRVYARARTAAEIAAAATP